MNYQEICKVDVPEGQSGNWKIDKFEVPKGDISAIPYALHGRPVPAGIYTRLTRNGAVVMSDTPAEIRDIFKPLYQAHQRGGRILIHGLGLGVLLKGVLSFPNVEHVDIVEKSQDVISLVAPSYQDSRVTIHHSDVFDMKWNGTRWNIVWHDIWDSICSDNLDDMKKLHRKYGRKCDWQGSWCRYECERM